MLIIAHMLLIPVLYASTRNMEGYSYFEAGKQELASGNTESAIASFSLSLQSDKENLETCMNLAGACVQFIEDTGINVKNYEQKIHK